MEPRATHPCLANRSLKRRRMVWTIRPATTPARIPRNRIDHPTQVVLSNVILNESSNPDPMCGFATAAAGVCTAARFGSLAGCDVGVAWVEPSMLLESELSWE